MPCNENNFFRPHLLREKQASNESTLTETAKLLYEVLQSMVFAQNYELGGFVMNTYERSRALTAFTVEDAYYGDCN